MVVETLVAGFNDDTKQVMCSRVGGERADLVAGSWRFVATATTVPVLQVSFAASFRDWRCPAMTSQRMRALFTDAFHAE
jgi:hypothetical protein